MKLLVFSILIGLPVCTFGQDSTWVPPKLDFKPKKTSSVIWECCCSTEAGFPGGTKEFHRYLQSELNFTGIPDLNSQDENRIYVQFIVDEYGAIQDIDVNKTDNKEVIKEIESALLKMPEWIPGEEGGNIIKTRVRIPIKIVWEDYALK